MDKKTQVTLKFEVPNKRRLNERIIDLLTMASLDFGEDAGRRLYVKAKNQDVDVLFLRAQDIPEFVATNAIDIEITGLDQATESGYGLVQALELRFGHCHMAVAAPESSDITDASQIVDSNRIATSYLNITRRYFELLEKDVSIIIVTGAAEIIPYLDIFNYIVDLVSIGSILKMNRMIEAGRILDSQAAVFTSETARGRYSDQIDKIISSVLSVIKVENRRYIMVDVPRDRLTEVEGIILDIRGPPSWTSSATTTTWLSTL